MLDFSIGRVPGRIGRTAAFLVFRMAVCFGIVCASVFVTKRDGLACVMVEVALPGTAHSEAMTTIIAKDASGIAKAAREIRYQDKTVPTGDSDFDSRYTVSGDASRVTPALRADLVIPNGFLNATLSLPLGDIA